MKKILLILNFFLLCLACFFIYRNYQIKKQQETINASLHRNLVILDSLIQIKYNYLISNDEFERFNKDALNIIKTGDQLVQKYNKSSFYYTNQTKYKEFFKIAKYDIKENFFNFNEDFTPLDIKLLQLWYLEKMNNYIIPEYKFDAYRIIAVEEELKQKKKSQEIQLWFEYVSLCHDDKEYVKIIYNNDTISKKDFYFKINYTPSQKGPQFIPVKVLFKHQNKIRDYKIYLNVK